MSETTPKIKKPIYKRVWLWIIIIVIALVAINGFGNDTTPAPTEKNTSVTKAEVKEEPKVATAVTVDDLVATLEGNALNASNTYKDKYVAVTGKLENIDSSGEYFTIGVMSGEITMYSVECYIEKEHLNTVSSLTTGQQITVTGTITDVGEILGYSLDVESIK